MVISGRAPCLERDRDVFCRLLSTPPTSCRSPSPEPIYNSEGKRLNTREYRTRKKIEEERHSLITEMVGLNPDFKPPADYKYVRLHVFIND